VPVTRKTRAKSAPEPQPQARGDVKLHVQRPQARRVLGGVAERTFASLEQEGVLVAMKRGRGGRASVYDLEALVPAYLVHISKQRPTPERDARARRDMSQAEFTEMKLARERGELIERETVIKEGQAFCKAWSAKVRSWPRRARQQGIIVNAEQEAALTGLCRELLIEVSRWRTMGDTHVVDAEVATL
jgi:phage terminase Nu1 subunit (DNA packaging protein)